MSPCSQGATRVGARRVTPLGLYVGRAAPRGAGGAAARPLTDIEERYYRCTIVSSVDMVTGGRRDHGGCQIAPLDEGARVHRHGIALADRRGRRDRDPSGGCDDSHERPSDVHPRDRSRVDARRRCRRPRCRRPGIGQHPHRRADDEPDRRLPRRDRHRRRRAHLLALAAPAARPIDPGGRRLLERERSPPAGARRRDALRLSAVPVRRRHAAGVDLVDGRPLRLRCSRRDRAVVDRGGVRRPFPLGPGRGLRPRHRSPRGLEATV